MEAIVDSDREDDGDYYQIPRRSNREAVIDPYTYEIYEQEVLLPSLVVPIRDSTGAFIGIFGLDVALDQLQEFVEGMRVGAFSEATMALYWPTGLVVGSDDASELGRSVVDFSADQGLADAVFANETFDIISSTRTGMPVFSVSVPVEIGETGLRWISAVNVRAAEVYANATGLVRLVLLIGVTAI